MLTLAMLRAMAVMRDANGSGTGTRSFVRPTRRNLPNCAVTLVDRDVGVGVAIGIRVGNVNASERLPANDAWTLGVRTVQRLEERVVLVGITLRPSVHSYGLDVASRLESPTTKHASELITEVAFKNV